MTFNNEYNQLLFCDMFSFDPMNGKVCLNQSMPDQIRRKLAQDPTYLEVLRDYQDRDFSKADHRFWSFPSYSKGSLQRSVTPNRGTAVKIDEETLADYL